jgi:hypothetical protein
MFLRYWPTAGAFIGDVVGALCLAVAIYAGVFAAGIMGGAG